MTTDEAIKEPCEFCCPNCGTHMIGDEEERV